jgi:hypothetical protein
MSIWIILKYLVGTYRECIFCHYWAIVLCIHPSVKTHQSEQMNLHVIGVKCGIH